MSFHLFIKKFREEHDLSQECFSQFLSKKFSGRQFIDAGTVSRWERRVNTPSLYNQIYILRKLNINFSIISLMSHPEIKDGNVQAIKLLQSRFNRFSGLADKPYRAALPSFSYSESSDIKSFTNDKILRVFNHDVLGMDFFSSKLLNLLLTDIDVDDINIIKFYHDEQIVGHMAYAKVGTLKLVEFLNQHSKSNIHTHFDSELDGKVLLNFSAYASDFSLYLFYSYHIIKYLEKDTNIDWYVGHSFINDDWQVQKKLGAKIMICGNSAEKGRVKVGTNYTDSVMFFTSASTLLSSPLSMLKLDNVGDFANVVKITDK